jgi:phosphopantothenoylcysteine decarboxylase/phosphopantothenate--cysteine ligase
MPILVDKHILLGVTGSIAAYKAADLASKLAQAGARVDVILTPSAEKFVTPLTFQSVTGRRAYTDTDLWGSEAHVLHIGLAHPSAALSRRPELARPGRAQRAGVEGLSKGGSSDPDLLVIAPCTANTLAKLAHGGAEGLLAVVALSARCPLLIAPAMESNMFAHPATQKNLATLIERGAFVAGPAAGHLASGASGPGRMIEVPELLGHIRLVLGQKGPLAGKKVVVTAGGTQEPLDPVRVLTNRSSGKQGYALAQAALEAGARVCLISTVNLPPPVGACVVEVHTAQEMLEAVLAESATADALIMAAAVADFRPKTIAESKLKKRDGIPQVELEAAPDILEAVASQEPILSRRAELVEADAEGSGENRPRVVVGFAAESRDLLENATNKLESKKLDIIAANDISASDAGFSVDTNRVTLLYADGRYEALPLMSKSEVAETIVARVAALLE